MRDREHVVEKPKGVVRIACLGDSVTLGWGIPPESAYPQQLQDRLDARGLDAEVLNVALGGWTTRQELIAYRRIARRYRPDHVILGICLNDVPEMQNNLSRPPAWLSTLFRRSALVRAAVGAQRHEIRDVEELFAPEERPPVQQGFEKLFAEVRTLRREVEKDGASLGVIVFPFRFQVREGAPPARAQERLGAFLRSERLPHLDLLPVLRPLGDAAFHDYDHLTPEGARATADAVASSGWFGAHSAGAGPEDGDGPGGRDALPISVLVAQLDDPAPAHRAAAAWALSDRAEEPTVATRRALERRLQDAEPEVRAGAARALSHWGAASAETSGALARLLDDPSEKVRRRAAEALEHTALSASCCLETLAAIAARAEAPGRAAAVWLIGRLGTAARRAVPLLVGALEDPREEVRWKAAWALGEMGAEAREAVPALVRALDDAAIRWRVVDALGNIGRVALPAVPALTPLVRDPSSSVRFRAARALGRIAPSRSDVALALMAAARDPQENVRLAAVRGLGPEARGEAVTDSLIAGLRDPDARVRGSAAELLGRRAEKSAIGALMSALEDQDDGVRLASARALRKVALGGPLRLDGLAARAAREGDPTVRAELERALSAVR